MKQVRVGLGVLISTCTFGLPIGAGVFGSPSYAYGSGACGQQGNYHEGYASNAWRGTQPEAVEGVSSTTTDQGGYVLCTGQPNFTNFSTAWVMIVNPTGAGWVQSGSYYQYGFSCVQQWAQEYEGPGYRPYNFFKPYGCSSPGAVHTYAEDLVGSSSYSFDSSVDGYVLHQTNWNPYSNWSTPFGLQVESETTYPQSDIPGTRSSPYDFASIKAQNAPSGSWSDLCGSQNLGAVQEDANFAEYAVACDHIHTWTVRP